MEYPTSPIPSEAEWSKITQPRDANSETEPCYPAPHPIPLMPAASYQRPNQGCTEHFPLQTIPFL